MWEYAEAGRLLTLRSIGATVCLYCRHSMCCFPAQKFELEERRLLVQFSICAFCGWWSVYRVIQGENPRTPGVEGYSGAIGCLKELDLADVSIPLEEVRQYLLAKKDSLFKANPKIFEDIVCSVFRDLGWHARVTAYRGDNGVDVILDGHEGSTIGVQVKRYGKKRMIEAEQIRSLAGALLVNGHTRGVFVTTSNFRRGARKTAAGLAAIGYPIELVDAERFLAALGVAQVKSFSIDNKRFAAWVTGPGVHVGSGLEKAFVQGENLFDREIAAQFIFSDEIIEAEE